MAKAQQHRFFAKSDMDKLFDVLSAIGCPFTPFIGNDGRCQELAFGEKHRPNVCHAFLLANGGAAFAFGAEGQLLAVRVGDEVHDPRERRPPWDWPKDAKSL